LLAVGIFSMAATAKAWNGVGAADYMGAPAGRQRPHPGDTKQFVAQSSRSRGSRLDVIVGGLAFYIIGKILGSNRVPAAVEIAGLDVPEMGMPGYPESSRSCRWSRCLPRRSRRPKANVPALANS